MNSVARPVDSRPSPLPARRWRAPRWLAFAAALVVPSCAERPAVPSALPPVVAGLAAPGLAAPTRGLVLLGELGCVACHAGDAAAPLAQPRLGPDLATLGGRVHADYVARFLADPLAVAQGTTMPDLLRDRDDRERPRAAAALAQYLRSFDAAAPAPALAPSPATAEAIDAAAAPRGRVLFHEIGCVMCHAPRDEAGSERPLPDSVPLADLAGKYPLPGLRAFLLAPHAARPAARMPDFHLTPAQAHDLASYLLAGAPPRAAPPLPPVDPEQVAMGRVLFAERGCVHCHALADPSRAPAARNKPLRALDPTRGCLSASSGPWPFYALSTAQRSDLQAALAAAGSPRSAEEHVQQLLASRNCTACHARGDRGGVTKERDQYCVGGDPNIGPDGRLPPPLTGVGSKLRREWLQDTIAHGQRERAYLGTRMPGFGASFAAELADLLAHTDVLPPVAIAPLPEDEKEARAVTDLGRELVGDKGMNCIACHTFAADRVGTMGAIDLVATTAQRLRPEWFVHYLRAPFRFNPGTLMPQFFPDGKSSRAELGGGDATRQIEAMWHYLAEGRNVGKPSGMRRPPIELVVGDETVLLRRSVQNTGKRGISVGYPGGVSLTFDAERLALNQIWWGKFVDAAPVWTGQGSGEARILGKERVALPNGPAFAELPAPEAPWPDSSRRELGQRFLGYDLDQAQRPTFRYECAGVTIHDTPREVPVAGADADATTGGKPMLRRTLQFTSAVDKTLHFRAARAARIDDLGAGAVQVGATLRLHLPPASCQIRAVGEERELRVAVALTGGRAELVVDYTWVEAGK